MITKDNLDEIQPEERKNYIRPAIVHELDLETRAGSPLGMPDPLNLDGTDF
ncbi:MAG: hypothetical protein JW908_10240 [Anaerolineales bacterium]|nr:hypothetical protein [Anaerolineales bacterium]